MRCAWVIVFAAACAAAPAGRDASSVGVDKALAMAAALGQSREAETVRTAQRARATARYERDAYVVIGRAWMLLARTTYDEGYVEHAAAAARLALDVAPRDTRANTLLAQARLSAHDFRGAAALAGAVLTATPDATEALAVLSDAKLELGDIDDAERLATDLVSLQRDLFSLARLAHLAWLHGDEASAIADYEDALAFATPNDREASAWVTSERALVDWHAGRYSVCMSRATQALRMVGDYPPALLARGRCALGAGDSSEAREDFTRAAHVHATVEALWLAGDVSGAIALGERADKRTLAAILATGPEAQRALQLIDEELKTRGDAITHDVRSQALMTLGRIDDAVGESDMAAKLAPLDRRVRAHRTALLAIRTP